MAVLLNTATWTWDGTEWTQLLVSSPPPSDYPMMSSLNGNLVLFGGDVSSDTWTFDGTTWTQLTTSSSPSGRSGGVMAPLGGKLVLFGGYDGGGNTFADTWTFDGAAWRQLHISGPPARGSAVMAPLGDTLVLFGGEMSFGDRHSPSYNQLSDTWTFDGTRWTQESPATSPHARSGAVMGALGDKLVLYGGAPGAPEDCGTWSDTWTWDGSRWAQLTVPGPIDLWASTMAPLGSTLVLWGGHTSVADACTFSNSTETLLWDGNSWATSSAIGSMAGFGIMAAL